MPPSSIALRVLLVDDEILVQELLRSALEEAGYEVLAADDVDAAVKHLESGISFGGLVTDINLGGPRSGWDVARRAREMSPRLPVVYISGDSGFQWRSQGVPNSAIIEKPLAPSQVIVALASLTTEIAAIH